MAHERIFHGMPSDLTHMQNLHQKRARCTHKLKPSTVLEINSLKVNQACNSQDNFYVGDVWSGSASYIHNWLAVRAKTIGLR